MKKMILVMTLLASSYSYAGQACSALYASGVGHVFKGMGRPVGDKEKILEGQTSQDDMYTVAVTKGVPSLSETKSGKAVPMKSEEVAPGMQMYGTGNLALYPDGVPGAFGGRQFIIILCADESAF